jgi:hypothetical protein
MTRATPLWCWSLCSFFSHSVLGALITSDGSVRVASFISAPCSGTYASVDFTNISHSYFEGKNTPIAVMNRDPIYQLANRTIDAAELYAINLDVSGSYGGYPEDLAEAAARLGYDLLIVRGSGDDFQANIFSRMFWRHSKCPMPVFRIGLVHDSELRNIESTSLFSISHDSSPSPNADIAIAVIDVAIQCVFITLTLFFLSLKKLRDLYISGMIRTTGSIVTVVCFGQAVLLFITGLSGAFPGVVPFSDFSIYLGLNLALSIISLYAVAYRFQLVVGEVSGKNKPLLRSPWRISGVLITNIGILLAIIGLVNSYRQTPTTGLIGWYNMSVIFYFLFRLVISSYFFWGYFFILKFLKASGGDLGTDRARRLSMMSSRVLATAIFTLASLVCISYGLLPAFDLNHGYVFVGLSTIFTGLSAITELLAVQVKKPSDFDDNCIFYTRRIFSRCSKNHKNQTTSTAYQQTMAKQTDVLVFVG